MKIKYYVNKDKGTVICVGEECGMDALHKLVGNNFYFNESVMDLIRRNEVQMKDKFIGKAYCSSDDEWNEEIGKSFAKERMLDSYVKAKVKKMNEIIEEFEKFTSIMKQAEHRYKAKVNMAAGKEVFKSLNADVENKSLDSFKTTF